MTTFPLLALPILAIDLTFSLADFMAQINFSLACRRSQKIAQTWLWLRRKAPQKLRVAITPEYSDVNYVKVHALDEEGDVVAAWTIQKIETFDWAPTKIGDSYIHAKCVHDELTNVAAKDVYTTAANLIKHLSSFIPEITWDVFLNDLTCLELTQQESFCECISQAKKIDFKYCYLPDEQFYHFQNLFRPHHHIIITCSRFGFSDIYSVKKFELRAVDDLENFVRKSFKLLKCQEFEISGHIFKNDVLRMLYMWKYGNNPHLKMMKLLCTETHEDIVRSLRAKRWETPGPRVFELDNFRLDCKDGRNITGKNGVRGTLNFMPDDELIFVVWD